MTDKRSQNSYWGTKRGKKNAITTPGLVEKRSAPNGKSVLCDRTELVGDGIRSVRKEKTSLTTWKARSTSSHWFRREYQRATAHFGGTVETNRAT